MSESTHQRHKPPIALQRARELIVACAPLRSQVNLSRIVRAASCCGVQRIIACGNAKIDPKIAREGAQFVELEVHRSLFPSLKKLKLAGYRLVGLEQATNSHSLYKYSFHRRTVLIVGNERHGLGDEILRYLDAVVEIPVYGVPYSHNAATAAGIGLYEYCRQFPEG